MSPADPLTRYREKRDFARTPEPSGQAGQQREKLSFVVQRHAATRLHYDLRLEWHGVMKSWAVTRGPSLDPADKRLAVEVEDHPLDYATFEGTIPKPAYGGGTVQVWDRGLWAPLDPATVDRDLADGELKFVLSGERLKGGFVLVRLRPRKGESEKRHNWLLIKEKDSAATPGEGDAVLRAATSVQSGRTLDEIAAGSDPKAEKKKAVKPGKSTAARKRTDAGKRAATEKQAEVRKPGTTAKQAGLKKPGTADNQAAAPEQATVEKSPTVRKNVAARRQAVVKKEASVTKLSAAKITAGARKRFASNKRTAVETRATAETLVAVEKNTATRKRAAAKKTSAATSRRTSASNTAITDIPRFVPPQLCKLVDTPPTGEHWVHELKLDGYRLQLRVQNGKPVLRTRTGLDWTERFPAIAQAAAALPDCLIDGEGVALDA